LADVLAQHLRVDAEVVGDVFDRPARLEHEPSAALESQSRRFATLDGVAVLFGAAVVVALWA
jgi:hypothetical protein